jgi:hypothetical protein
VRLHFDMLCFGRTAFRIRSTRTMVQSPARSRITDPRNETHFSQASSNVSKTFRELSPFYRTLGFC